MAMSISGRSREQVIEHYQVEKELAARLRSASCDERRSGMYTSVYDELLRRVRHHPLLNSVSDPTRSAGQVAYHVNSLAPFIKPDTVFLEVGAGECALSLALAPRVKHVYALDVSNEITARVRPPPNFTLVISNGTNIPVPAGSVNVAYSNQLMEHLHPDDAAEQLREIFAALAPGGTYLCCTPNRFTGPHDISREFDAEATGLHLHEYCVRELDRILRNAGFRSTRIYFPSRHVLAPVGPFAALESTLAMLPTRSRRTLASGKALRGVLGIRMVATK
jgi:SAM-dependent methyltransferase